MKKNEYPNFEELIEVDCEVENVYDKDNDTEK